AGLYSTALSSTDSNSHREPSMPRALPVSAVNHVGITTRRLEESKAFYRDVLGFREVSRPNFNFRGVWLFNHGLMIHLIENEAAGERTDEIQTRDNHLALHSDDLALVEQLLAQHGVQFGKNEI